MPTSNPGRKIVVSRLGNVGIVDEIEAPSSIKLTKSDSPDGKHHLIPRGVGRSYRCPCPPVDECRRRSSPLVVNQLATRSRLGRSRFSWRKLR